MLHLDAIPLEIFSKINGMNTTVNLLHPMGELIDQLILIHFLSAVEMSKNHTNVKKQRLFTQSLI